MPSVKLPLLRILENVHDAAKARTLETSLQALGEESKVQTWKALFGPLFDEFAALVLSAFDASSVADLNDSSSPLWQAFVTVVRFCFGDSTKLSRLGVPAVDTHF